MVHKRIDVHVLSSLSAVSYNVGLYQLQLYFGTDTISTKDAEIFVYTPLDAVYLIAML